ncbi:MAG: hypothetical protein ACTSU2_14370 [Promethearchaeota archaeon]
MAEEKKKISTFEEAFKTIIDRYENNEKVRKPLRNFDLPIQITCLDTNHNFLILVNKDQGIEIKDNEFDENAPIKIHFTEEQVLFDLLNGDLGAVKSYSSGKVKVIEGEVRNLLRLRKLLF